MSDVVHENAVLRDFVRRLVQAVNFDDGYNCRYCAAHLAESLDSPHLYGTSVTRHRSGCPWRQAKEYVDGLEAKP